MKIRAHCGRRKAAVLSTAFAALCLLPTVAIHAKERAIPATDSSSCSEWRFGDHQSSIAAQLNCLQTLPKASLAGIGEAELRFEINYHYEQIALHGDRATAEILRVLVNERERRQPAGTAPSTTIYQALLSSGSFAEAEQERREKHLDVPELPPSRFRHLKAIAPHEASYWSFDSTGKSMIESSIDLRTGPHIVVYSAPGCHFCPIIAKDLAADPQLLALFKAHSIWIGTPDGGFSANYYSEWNSAHPELPIHVIFSHKNWPRQRIPATPDLYFLKDGKQVGEILGWMDGSNQKLLDNLAAIGLR